jgi:hypothetical protein
MTGATPTDSVWQQILTLLGFESGVMRVRMREAVFVELFVTLMSRY